VHYVPVLRHRDFRLLFGGQAVSVLGDALFPVALAFAVLDGLDVIAAARRHADGVAEAYVQLFLNEIWKPFVDAGRPQERWPEVREALERLRPLAAEVLLAVFGLAMTEATERAFGRELDLIKDEVRREEAA